MIRIDTSDHNFHLALAIFRQAVVNFHQAVVDFHPVLAKIQQNRVKTHQGPAKRWPMPGQIPARVKNHGRIEAQFLFILSASRTPPGRQAPSAEL